MFRSKKSYSKFGVRVDAKGVAARTIDNVVFHSLKEARRYKELKLQGIKFKLQYRIPIVVNGKKVCDYIADFVYYEGTKFVVEDVKGFETPTFKLKWKLLQALHPEWLFRIT